MPCGGCTRLHNFPAESPEIGSGCERFSSSVWRWQQQWSPFLLSPPPSGCFFFIVLFGLVTAPLGPLRYAVLSETYDEYDGTAIGLTLAAGNVGNSILPVVAGVCAAYASWRFGFGILIPLFFLTTIGLFYSLPRSSVSKSTDSFSVNSLRAIVAPMRNQTIILLTTVQICAFFRWQGFAGFYPTYLVDVKGLSGGAASVLFGLFFVTGVAVQTGAGIASDQVGVKRTLLFIGAVVLVSFSILSFVDGVLILILLTVLLSSLNGFTPVTHTYLANTMPQETTGSDLGLLRTVFMTASAISPYAVGTVADHISFDAAFIMLAGVCAIGLLIVILTPVAE